MMVFALILLVLVALGLPLFVRPSHIPEPEPIPPTQHLEDRKAAIYDNLRDLQAEYRMGKLSDEDYQRVKRNLQKELATVLAGIEAIEKGESGAAPQSEPAGQQS